MATPIVYTKKLTLSWNDDTPLEIGTLREAKINQMINEDKTDGEWTQNPESVSSTTVFGGWRKFVDQAAAEEFRSWILTERAKYGHTPISAEITDL